MRHLALRAAMALLAITLAGVATARADSVEQFKTVVLPALNPAKLTYGTAIATGPNSLTLSDVVVTPPPDAGTGADKPVSIKTVTIDDIDFDGIGRGDAPARLHIRLDDVSSAGSSEVPPDLVKILGPGPYKANLELDYTIIDGKELRLKKLAFDMPGLAAIQIALDVDGIEPSGANIKDASFDAASLREGSITYEDHSLLGKVVTAMAKAQKRTEAALVKEWSGAIAVLAGSQGNDETPLVNAALALLRDYRQPKGPLTITFAPTRDASGGKPITDAMTDGVAKTLGASATYAGKPVTAPPK